eukprot:12206012-Alexandrium_andersonii.AAC.1
MRPPVSSSDVESQGAAERRERQLQQREHEQRAAASGVMSQPTAESSPLAQQAAAEATQRPGQAASSSAGHGGPGPPPGIPQALAKRKQAQQSGQGAMGNLQPGIYDVEPEIDVDAQDGMVIDDDPP